VPGRAPSPKNPGKKWALSGGVVNIKITAMTFGDGQVSCETCGVTETVIRDVTNHESAAPGEHAPG